MRSLFEQTAVDAIMASTFQTHITKVMKRKASQRYMQQQQELMASDRGERLSDLRESINDLRYRAKVTRDFVDFIMKE